MQALTNGGIDGVSPVLYKETGEAMAIYLVFSDSF